MEPETITCALCGAAFDPKGNVACGACPLNRGCQMVCCPNCGYTNVDGKQSSLVRWLSNLRGAKKHDQRTLSTPQPR